MPERTMSAGSWGLLLLLSVIWGSAFLFGKLGVAEIPPATLMLLRSALAAAVLLVTLRALAMPFPGPHARWRDLAVMALLNNALPGTLIFLGQTQLSVGLAAILNAAAPLFTVIVLHAFANERAAPAKAGGALIGLAGTAILVGPDALDGLGLHVWAQLACIAAALCYAFALLWGRRLARTPPLAIAAGQFAASSVMMLPVALLWDRPWTLPWPSAGALWSVVLLGVVSSAFAHALYFRIMQRAGAVNVALVTFLVPISAIAMGAAALGEVLTGVQAAGFAVILAGLAVIDGRLFRRRAGRLPQASR